MMCPAERAASPLVSKVLIGASLGNSERKGVRAVDKTDMDSREKQGKNECR